MIVYSFAWRKQGHSPCNVRLAEAAIRALKYYNEEMMIFAQRPTAAVLKERGVDCNAIKKTPGYEGSEQPTEQAAEAFRRAGIMEVIPIAHTPLQLWKCVGLVRIAGFKTPSFLKLMWLIGWIGFDWLSAQPWTRDPFRMVFYTIRQVFFGYRPPPEYSE